MMNLLLLLFGAIMGNSLASWLWPAGKTAAAAWPIGPGKDWPAVALLALSLTVAFNIPWRKSAWGMIGGAMAVGLFGNSFARIAKAPSSAITTQGIILLVPGSATYMALNQWIIGTAASPGANVGSQALMLFVALVAGLHFANALLPPGKSL